MLSLSYVYFQHNKIQSEWNQLCLKYLSLRDNIKILSLHSDFQTLIAEFLEHNLPSNIYCAIEFFQSYALSISQ